MLISIVVPVYNGMQYISRCLDSLVAQTFQSIEIIAVDDGSKDESYKLLKEYSNIDNRVKVFTKENGGVSSARNYGLNQAQGDYIMFVDIDDYVDVTICQKLYSEIIKGFDYVVCGYKKIESFGIKEVLPAEGYENDNVFQNQFKLLLNQAAIYTPWGKLFKRALIKEEFDKNRNIGEDFEFNLKYFESCNQITWLNEALYYYDTTIAGSLSKKLENSLGSDIELCQMTEIFMEKKGVVYPNFNRKYYEKFRLHLQRAYEQGYTYLRFKTLFVRLCEDGGYKRVAMEKKTEGLLNKLTRFSINANLPLVVYLIISVKKKLFKNRDKA